VRSGVEILTPAHRHVHSVLHEAQAQASNTLAQKHASHPPVTTGVPRTGVGGPLPPKKLLIERLRKPGWYVLSCLIFLFYLWTATSSNRPFHPRDTSQEFYNQLTDSLMQGHTYLAAKAVASIAGAAGSLRSRGQRTLPAA